MNMGYATDIICPCFVHAYHILGVIVAQVFQGSKLTVDGALLNHCNCKRC